MLPMVNCVTAIILLISSANVELVKINQLILKKWEYFLKKTIIFANYMLFCENDHHKFFVFSTLKY